MTEVGFYQLLKWPLEKALPRLLARAHERGLRAVVRVGSEDRLQALNSVLWTYDPGSFLPHGGPADGNASQQPIYLTTEAENPNEATVLILTDSLEAADIEKFDRCIDMFDGNDETALAAARDRWRRLKDTGHELTYWRQTEDGRWEKQS